MRAWCRKNEAQVPSLIEATDPQTLVRALDEAGLLDFEKIEQGQLPEFYRRVGAWPSAMEPTCDLVRLGVIPADLELEANEAREAKRKAEETARLESDLAFENVVARWLEHYENEKGRRPRTVEQARHVVNAHLLPALKGTPMPHIARANLQPILDAIPVKHRASRLAVYAYASVLFAAWWLCFFHGGAAVFGFSLTHPEPVWVSVA